MRNSCFSNLPILAVALLLGSCHGSRNKTATTGGDPGRGASAISQYGCGSCHTIPGIVGAHGLVGPSLAGLGSRMYIAGMLPNAPGNLVRWVKNPKSINEKTVMPNLGVTTRDAADIGAYLYSVK
ncbi:MAG TPA: c-type cytochrome [Bryobacteraceae bacterium]|nr:c-type cytochrome [Bryobacteraceae bacterium]